ncbi:unnamed protein product [marine sediment metagenome]|uniref:Uncharacterized protein n=1 Tax=marine sediment metagenome TaxID=412755 RepID=X0T1Y8_9ZZZZ
MRKAYGNDVVTRAIGAGKDMLLEDDNWLEDFTFQVDGDTATAMEPGYLRPVRLVRKDGLWKIEPKSMLLSTGLETESQVKMFQLLTGAIADVSRKIGQAGYTAEKINQELSKAMMMATNQAVSGPALPGQ